MTAQVRSLLKGVFEDGDQPSGANFADLIDSFVSIADTTAQSISSNLTVPTLVASVEVSSPLVNATTVNAVTVSASTMTATRIDVTTVSASVITASDVSANSIQASSMAATLLGVTTLSAANATLNALTFTTAQATATSIAGNVMVVPTTAAGYITVQVCGATAAIPYFKVS